MDDEALVRLWSIKCFRTLGFTRDEAIFLYMEEIDWHEMEALLCEGCPPDLAERILRKRVVGEAVAN